MANIAIRDGTGTTVYVKASGVGSDLDPFIFERLDSHGADLLAAVDGVEATLSSILASTDGQVDVVSSALPTGASSAANQATLITALGTLLTELQAKADLSETQPVSGIVTAATAVVAVTPFAAAFATSGDNTVIAAPGVGNRLVIPILAAQNESAVATTILFKSGATTRRRGLLQNQGDGISWAFEKGYEWRLGENEAFVVNLSGPNSVGINVDSFVEVI